MDWLFGEATVFGYGSESVLEMSYFCFNEVIQMSEEKPVGVNEVVEVNKKISQMSARTANPDFPDFGKVCVYLEDKIDRLKKSNRKMREAIEFVLESGSCCYVCNGAGCRRCDGTGRIRINEILSESLR